MTPQEKFDAACAGLATILLIFLVFLFVTGRLANAAEIRDVGFPFQAPASFQQCVEARCEPPIMGCLNNPEGRENILGHCYEKHWQMCLRSCAHRFPDGRYWPRSAEDRRS